VNVIIIIDKLDYLEKLAKVEFVSVIDHGTLRRSESKWFFDNGTW